MNVNSKWWKTAVSSCMAFCMAVITMMAGVNIPLAHAQDSPAKIAPGPAAAAEGTGLREEDGPLQPAPGGGRSGKTPRLSRPLSLRLSVALAMGERNWLRRDEFLAKDGYQEQRQREAWRRTLILKEQ